MKLFIFLRDRFATSSPKVSDQLLRKESKSGCNTYLVVFIIQCIGIKRIILIEEFIIYIYHGIITLLNVPFTSGDSLDYFAVNR